MKIKNKKPKIREIITNLYYKTVGKPLWCDRTIYNFIKRLGSEKKLLNVGSGNSILETDANCINLDINNFPNVNIVADAHKIPFPNDSFDYIFANALLEHVKNPFIVVSEMRRVLKKGGDIIINVPFLEEVHAEEDYYRFTLKGLKNLFNENFKEIKSGQSAGPSQAFVDIFRKYCALPFKECKLIYDIVTMIVAILLFPLRFMDFIIFKKNKPLTLCRSYYYIGKKIK